MSLVYNVYKFSCWIASFSCTLGDHTCVKELEIPVHNCRLHRHVARVRTFMSPHCPVSMPDLKVQTSIAAVAITMMPPLFEPNYVG